MIDPISLLPDWQQWLFIALACFLCAVADPQLAPVPALVSIFAHDARGAQLTLLILPFYALVKFIRKGGDKRDADHS